MNNLEDEQPGDGFQFRPVVTELHASALDAQRAKSEFAASLKTSIPRVVVTPLLAAACLLWMGVAIFRGASVVDPTAQDGLTAGACYGPSVFTAQEYWRLISCQFVHFGLFHLVFNIWCLLVLGPLVERLYGHFFFLALYLLAGAGGALLSMAINPMNVSAGASGAIFGIIGALAAFLLVHRHTIPRQTLESLRGSVIAFVGYNLLFGVLSPRIDMAAHIGGLLTGLVAGLVVQRPWPPSPERRAFARRISGLAVCVALLCASAYTVRGWVSEKNAKLAELEHERDEHRAAVDSFNTLMRAAHPQRKRLQQLARNLDSVLARLNEGEIADEQAAQQLEDTRTAAQSCLDEIQRAEPSREDLKPVHKALVDAHQTFVRVAEAGLDVTRAPDDRIDQAVVRFNNSCEQRVGAEKRLDEAIQRYASSYNMNLVKLPN